MLGCYAEEREIQSPGNVMRENYFGHSIGDGNINDINGESMY